LARIGRSEAIKPTERRPIRGAASRLEHDSPVVENLLGPSIVLQIAQVII
jgi:hypothetical protein